MAAAALQGARGRARLSRPTRNASYDAGPPGPDAVEQHSVEARAPQSVRDDFLADISHELRTPLVALLGYVELLGDTPLGRHQRDYADAIAAAGSNLLDILDDLTNLSRIETGQLAIHAQPFSIHDCVDGVAQMLAPSAYHKGLDFVRIVEPGVPALVQGDPLRLRQVLVNLVTNAIKFTRAGHVQIRAGVAAAGAAQTELEFTVTDTGIGIAAEDQRELFRPFARVNRSDAQGTGLGLVITKRLCEAMHGTLSVDSEPDRGSRFAVRIPFLSEQGPAATFPIDLTGRRILVVCSNEALADWLCDCLSRHGGHCDRANDEAAIEAVTLPDYDLALVFVGQGLLSGPDRLASMGAVLHERLNVLCLVGTGSGYSLERVERLFGGEALPAHAPAASICARVAELADSPPPAAAHGRESGHDALRGMRLLVAEDNAVSRDYLRIMLSGHGASVEVCKDGNEAVDLVQRRDFDLVLMDARMPDCDGSTAVRRLRAAGFSVPVIGLTASASECQDAVAAGMDECLVKPLRTPDLLQAISAVGDTRPDAGVTGRDFLDEDMLASLNAELPQHAQRLTGALERDDRAVLLEEAHKLNGIGSLCGFENLRRHASKLESCLRNGRPGDIGPLAGNVVLEVDAVCERIGRSQSET